MGPGGLEQRRLRESGSPVPSVISPTIWRAGQRVGGYKAGRVLMVERAASSVSKPSAQRVGVYHRPAPKAPQSPNLRWTHSLPVKKRPTPGEPK